MKEEDPQSRQTISLGNIKTPSSFALLRSEKQMFTSAENSVWLLEAQNEQANSVPSRVCRYVDKIARRGTMHIGISVESLQYGSDSKTPKPQNEGYFRIAHKPTAIASLSELPMGNTRQSAPSNRSRASESVELLIFTELHPFPTRKCLRPRRSAMTKAHSDSKGRRNEMHTPRFSLNAR